MSWERAIAGLTCANAVGFLLLAYLQIAETWSLATRVLQALQISVLGF